MSRFSFRRIAVGIAVAMAAAVPGALATKSVMLVTTHGVSMLPRFHTGDLAVLIPAASYHVGEIVGYYSPLLRTTVLHRIVAEHNGLFTFKGDHNDFVDPVQLPVGDIRGRLWWHIPKAGIVLGWLRSPAFVAACAAVLVVVSAGGMTRRRRARAGRATVTGGVGAPAPAGPATGLLKGAAGRGILIGAACFTLMAVACGLGALSSWHERAVASTDRAVPYTQNITFSYSGEAVPGTTYPGGTVRTGEPVFTRLVNSLAVTADYRFSAPSPALVHGKLALQAQLVGPSGWTSSLGTVSAATFTGGSATATVTIDLAQLPALATRFQSETGQSLDPSDVVVTPTVRVAGTFSGAAVSTSDMAALVFTSGGGALSLPSSPSLDGSQAARYPQLDQTTSGTATRSVPVAATTVVLGHRLHVTTVRWLMVVGGLLALTAALVSLVVWARWNRMDDVQRIHTLYGHDMVPVRSDPAESSSVVVDVECFDALARLAKRYDSVILEHAQGHRHQYFVECGVTLYRFVPAPNEKRVLDDKLAEALMTAPVRVDEALLRVAAGRFGGQSGPVAAGAPDGPMRWSPKMFSRRGAPTSRRGQTAVKPRTLLGAEMDKVTARAAKL